MIVLRRSDAVKKMARFYALSLERSLFGETSLVRRWGRIGTHGRRREEWFRAADAASAALGEMLVAKLKRGYQLVAMPAELKETQPRLRTPARRR